MSTPRFVVKRVGDEYVTVREEPYPRLSGYVGGAWAGLLLLLGVRSRGLLRRALLLAGLTVAIRAFKGEEWWLSLFRRGDGRLGQRPWGRTPSYQNDSPRIG